MFNKLLRQSLKPLKRVMHEKAYKEWLKLFDAFKKTTSFNPVTAKAMGFRWSVHHGETFLNQFESIFVDQIYKFESQTKQPVVIDCGANMGTSVLYFKWLYPNAKLYAFEPDAAIFEVLQQNVTNNKLSDVHLFNNAVWTNNSTMFFEQNNAQSGKLIFTENNMKVDCIRLKDFMKDHAHIDFLKLDIEGAELPVLKDIAAELGRVKHLFIEYHSAVNQPQNLSELLQILEKEGFRYFIDGNKSKSPFVTKVIEEDMDLTLDIFASKS